MKERFRLKPVFAVIALIALAAKTAAQTKDSVAFKIETIPSGAEIRVNGNLVGRAPLELLGYAPGPYAFSVSLRGYEVEEFSVNAVAGSRHAYRLSLKELTGKLIVSVIPENAEILIDDGKGASGSLTLAEGVHVVSARLFGFAEELRTADVREGEETLVEINLRPAPFRIEGLRSSRVAFDPESPPPFGETRIRFFASAPGSALMRIFSPSGEIVAERAFPEILTWEQGITWDGKDNLGKPLADGPYRVTVKADDASGVPAELETIVILDSSIRRDPRLLSGMASGSLLCPDASVQAVGGVEVRVDALLPVSLDWSGGFPFWTGLRAGIVKGLEGSMTARILTGEIDWALEASLKYRYLSLRGSPSLQGAAFLRGLLLSAEGAAVGSAGGPLSAIDAGFPLSVGLGPLEASLCPAIGIGFGSAGSAPRMGGAASIGFRLASFALQASADSFWALPTFNLASPPRIGIDASFLTPALISLSGGFLAELGAATSFNILLGAGFIF